MKSVVAIETFDKLGVCSELEKEEKTLFPFTGAFISLPFRGFKTLGCGTDFLIPINLGAFIFWGFTPICPLPPLPAVSVWEEDFKWFKEGLEEQLISFREEEKSLESATTGSCKNADHLV